MFNPKAALERIRRNKNQKEEQNSMTEGVQPLFPSSQQHEDPPNPTSNLSIESRIQKLQMLVSNLTDQLTSSNETVSRLKRQNSNLQTQILKLQYQNSQLKSTQVYSQLRRNSSAQRIGPNQSIREQPEKQNEPKKKMKSLHENRSMAISQPQKPKQPQYFSVEVEEVLQTIKQTPIQNILRRKQYEYKARKPREKNMGDGNRYLKDLADIEKNYKKTMKKPILVIKLDDADFE